MFSFHKPKIYRSLTGCCICRAKSSSSRFTDSAKYEPHFAVCFHLKETRSGDICNACVLLVKRFRKLPAGFQRHWGHVVDARANAKTRPKALLVKSDSTGSVGTDDNGDDDDDDEDDDDDDLIKLRTKSERRPKKRQRQPKWPANNSVRKSSSSESSRTQPDPLMSGFLDPKLWRRETVCCGTIFRGPMNAIVIDARFFTPCVSRRPSSTESPGCSSSSSPSSAEMHLKIDESSSGSEGSPQSYSPTFDRPALSTKMAVPAAL